MPIVMDGVVLEHVTVDGVEMTSVVVDGTEVFGHNVIYNESVVQQTNIFDVWTNSTGSAQTVYYKLHATTSTIGSGTSVSLGINSTALATNYYGDSTISGSISVPNGATLQLIQDRCACDVYLYLLK